MKVRDLVNELLSMPEDAEVCCISWDGPHAGYAPVDGVDEFGTEGVEVRIIPEWLIR